MERWIVGLMVGMWFDGCIYCTFFVIFLVDGQEGVLQELL